MSSDPCLIFGNGAGDDAAVYRLTDDLAIVQTVDFFTPMVDDPFDYGAIAAANSLSDCYAIGAKPITAMNLVTFPQNLSGDVLRAILAGGLEKITEAGAVLVGGHTTGGPEPMYGLSVTGTVHPDRMITNRGAKAGDVLVLTKEIGVGIASNALKSDELRHLVADETVAAVLKSMKTLNRAASEAMVEVGVNACTDVTGFGLLGHALNIAQASGMRIRIWAEKVPVFSGITAIAERAAGGAAKRNLSWIAPHCTFGDSVDPAHRAIALDAQTSGPLLMSVSPDRLGPLKSACRSRGVGVVCEIGEVLGGSGNPIELC